MNYAISYVSSANREISEDEIAEVLKYSRKWNTDHNITGLLLYSEGNFFQVIEGEKDKILSLFKNIQDDKRHYSIIKIFEREIKSEVFDGYESDFVSESTRYREGEVEEYLGYLNQLDPKVRNAVSNVLKAFLYR